MRRDIKEILFSEEQIKDTVKLLAKRISDDYEGKNLLVVGVLKGSVIFTSDIIRNITIPCEIDFMAVSSYGNCSETSGVVRILKDLDHSI
ncbi:MAG: phosphoribosyltransferase, partial [Clostridium sp.]